MYIFYVIFVLCFTCFCIQSIIKLVDYLYFKKKVNLCKDNDLTIIVL